MSKCSVFSLNLLHYLLHPPLPFFVDKNNVLLLYRPIIHIAPVSSNEDDNIHLLAITGSVTTKYFLKILVFTEKLNRSYFGAFYIYFRPLTYCDV